MLITPFHAPPPLIFAATPPLRLRHCRLPRHYAIFTPFSPFSMIHFAFDDFSPAFILLVRRCHFRAFFFAMPTPASSPPRHDVTRRERVPSFASICRLRAFAVFLRGAMITRGADARAARRDVDAGAAPGAERGAMSAAKTRDAPPSFRD
jgi:hypothetical protein